MPHNHSWQDDTRPPYTAQERAEARALIAWAIPRFSMNFSDKFEQDAEQFYRETGLMAPGKSMPLEMHPSNDDARRQAWAAWSEERQQKWIRALTIAVSALEDR